MLRKGFTLNSDLLTLNLEPCLSAVALRAKEGTLNLGVVKKG
jgi:hypothetical protein